MIAISMPNIKSKNPKPLKQKTPAELVSNLFGFKKFQPRFEATIHT